VKKVGLEKAFDYLNVKINKQLNLSGSFCRYGDYCALLAIGFFLVSSGCGLTTREAIIYHTLNYPPPDKEFRTPIPHTLMVYSFLLAPDVDSDSILTSRPKGAEKSVRLHRWQDNPADLVTDILLRDLQASGLFQKTVDQLSDVRYRYALEGTLRDLHGVIKNGHASAVVQLEVVFTDFEAPRSTEKDLLKKTYKVEIPSKDVSAESMLAAFNEGVKEISACLRGDIHAVLEARDDAAGAVKKSR
jgi:ABC-type uncharacterized transport system auxiliary subunit